MAVSPRRRHPALEGKPKGVWYAEAVGKVRGYPATPEAYARRIAALKATSDQARAAGRTSRHGVPTGWGGRREEVQRLREEAEREALRRIQTLYRNSRDPDEQLAADRFDQLGERPLAPLTDAEIRNLTDAERGGLVMTVLASMVMSPAYGTSTRLQAANILLPFLIPKPLRGRPVTGIDAALKFLDGLVEEMPPEP